MKKIAFITGTRADYGILAPIMRLIAASPEADLQIIATNMHLSPRFGMTVKEIEADGFNVDVKIPSLDDEDDSAEAVVNSMAKVEQGLAKAFKRLKPDIVVILGDRYEALAAASAAVVFNLPVAHLHGGETTEGAIDDKFRHAITQLSTLHFAATPQYADRIVSMGIDPACVFHSGAPGAFVDSDSQPSNTQNFQPYNFPTFQQFQPTPYILLAFHPVTSLPDYGISELKATLKALSSFINQGYRVLATRPNSDPGNKEIAALLEEFKERHPDSVTLETSLGSQRFHQAMEEAAAMIGNSSAALIEAPSHRLPAVNIGCRQKGRAHGVSVIDAPGDPNRIEMALQAALSMEMKAVCLGQPLSAINPYFKPDSAEFIARKLIEFEP